MIENRRAAIQSRFKFRPSRLQRKECNFYENNILNKFKIYMITKSAEITWRNGVFAFIPGFSPYKRREKIWG